MKFRVGDAVNFRVSDRYGDICGAGVITEIRDGSELCYLAYPYRVLVVTKDGGEDDWPFVGRHNSFCAEDLSKVVS